MFRRMVMFSIAAVLALGVIARSSSSKSASISGAWQVDSHHSAAQFVTDGTTDNGNKKIDVTVGFGRVEGDLRFDNGDPTKSNVNLHIYPATTMSPPLDEEGKVKYHMLENLPYETLLSFHSKKVVPSSNGQLQVTGDLIMVRIDRNVEATPTEAYSGPVYGPPIIHKVSREATFVFDIPPKGGSTQKASASTRVFREDFSPLVRSVLSTYWPPLVMDEKCNVPNAGTEAYSGAHCTGTYMENPSLPEVPVAAGGADYPGSPDYNAIVGERVNIVLHLNLTNPSTPSASGQ